MKHVRYLLPCTCGQSVAIETRQAGVEVQCTCGKWLTVPTLRGLRALERIEVDASSARAPGRTVGGSRPEPGAKRPNAGPVSEASPDVAVAELETSRSRVGLAIGSLSLVVVIVVCVGWYFWQTDGTEELKLLTNLVDTEEWILEQTPELKKLNRAALNLRLPDEQARDLFAPQLEVVGRLNESPPTSESLGLLNVARVDWRVEDVSELTDGSHLDAWDPLFSHLAYFERAKFYFVNADYASDQVATLHTNVGFEGLARDAEGHPVLVTAKMTMDWRNEAEPEQDPRWRIARWETKSLSLSQRGDLMFRDVLALALPDPELRERVRRSLHEEMLIEALRSDSVGPGNQFSQLELSTTEHHPGLSVVDVDQDGWDDLYVMGRWGRNILLRNLGDGTFEDVAPDYGLDIEDRCSSAVFADFDNDGDPDLMLGRSLKPSMYLVNEQGRFVDRSRELVEGPMPALVYSVAAADYNRDGLLDVYFSTSAIKADVDALRAILPPEDAAALEVELRQSDPHSVLAKFGPPNLLLVNRGGRFERAAENEQVAGWRNTNQATWGDFDDDGDPDLYLANDFSLNQLLRNDGDQGFRDVTEATDTGDIGFGMGASWGDYDNDQRLDLYVTNMFSKAGRRITAQIDSLDPRFSDMARGNSLFQNRDGRFEKVSGLELPAMQVEKAGWSWGGQFVDVDNNGFLDIYALSGYYTAPEEVALDVDL